MTADWASLEGRVINGVFPLHRLLADAERSAVFQSRAAANTAPDVALKLVPATPGQAEQLLSRWRSAMSLDHPHLLRLFEAGECEVDEQRYLYLVMEYAEQNLAQLLEHRALAPDEVRTMLGPTLNALQFLHASNHVHGGLKPSNVLVVGEQIKLASDAIAPASDVVVNGGARGAALSPYQPPEAGAGGLSTAGDVWALGVTTCEALSRRRPAGLHAVGGSIAVPADIGSPFREMITSCLGRHPEDRPDVARLRAWLKGEALDPVPAASQSKPTSTESTASPSQPISAPSQPISAPSYPTPAPRQLMSAPKQVMSAPNQERDAKNDAQESKSSPSTRLIIRAELMAPDEVPASVELNARWRPMRLVIAGLVLATIVVAGIYVFTSGDTSPRVASAPVPAPYVATDAASDAPADAPRSEAPASQAPEPALEVPPSARRATAVPPVPVPAVVPPVSSPQRQPPAPSPAAPSDSQFVIDEVMPVVPRSASQTIRGTVRVSVRVIVDRDGNVVAAISEDPGPSRYFERLSLDAAKKWRFVRAESGGERVMLVKFGYTRSGSSANASPIP